MRDASLSLHNGRLLLGGAVHFENAEAVLLQGRTLMATLSGPLIIDMSDLQDGNSVLVAVLLQWARDAIRERRDLHIAHMPDKLRAIIRVSGLREVLPESVQENP